MHHVKGTFSVTVSPDEAMPLLLDARGHPGNAPVVRLDVEPSSGREFYGGAELATVSLISALVVLAAIAGIGAATRSGRPVTCRAALVSVLTAMLLTAATVLGAGHDRVPAEALLVVLPLTFPVVANALGRVEIFAAGFSSWISTGFSFAWLAATETPKENPPWMVFALTSIGALMFSALPAAAGIAVAFAARRLLTKRGAQPLGPPSP